MSAEGTRVTLMRAATAHTAAHPSNLWLPPLILEKTGCIMLPASCQGTVLGVYHRDGASACKIPSPSFGRGHRLAHHPLAGPSRPSGFGPCPVVEPPGGRRPRVVLDVSDRLCRRDARPAHTLSMDRNSFIPYRQLHLDENPISDLAMMAANVPGILPPMPVRQSCSPFCLATTRRAGMPCK